jgi:peptide/nickel transport system permease protein
VRSVARPLQTVPPPSNGKTAGAILAARANQGYWSRSFQRFRENRLAVAMSLFILIEVAIAVAAPLLSRYVTGFEPDQQNLRDTFAAPGSPYWLGTDNLGRDTLTRLIYGAQVSLGVAALTVTMAVTLGTVVGLTAGFFGGWVDQLLMRLVDIILAIPAIFFLIMLAILFRPNPIGLAAIIASISWVSVARLVRSVVLETKHLDFIEAARCVGARRWRIMLSHLLPAVIPIMLVAASLQVAQVILAEAALSFLGLGIQPPTPSWGGMITVAQAYFQRAVWLVIFPGLSIFLTVLAVNLVGDSLRDALDPSLG